LPEDSGKSAGDIGKYQTGYQPKSLKLKLVIMSNLAKKVSISRDARLKPYYDTQKITDSTSVLNFFPPNPDKKVYRNNYISNPFPGEEDRMVIGLAFELTKQFIVLDSANSIDPELIINDLSHAGIRLTADNDYKEFLRAPLTHYMNLLGTDLDISTSLAGQAAADDQEAGDVKVVTMKSTSMQQVPDPFIIAGNQSMDLEVTFENNSSFPSDTNWSNSSVNSGNLWLKAKLYVAEMR
jgi:hypothetical protein